MDKSPKYLIKLLEARGWILKRIRGSHHIYFHPEQKLTIPVPVHGNKDVKTGLFLSILKAADITPDELSEKKGKKVISPK